jgi:3-methyladenine DNA glycosylase AlkD
MTKAKPKPRPKPDPISKSKSKLSEAGAGTEASPKTWAQEICAHTEKEFRSLADLAKAGPMQAYMKDHGTFLGVASPDRRAAQRRAWQGAAKPTEAELATAVRQLWGMEEREFHYGAIDLIAKFHKVCSADFVTGVSYELITTKSWWDTVDGLQHAVEPFVVRFPELLVTMREWLHGNNIWLARSAILHQLHQKQNTNEAVLFEFCTERATDPEFFIAKAIGWALREYSYVDARAVRSFIENTPQLRSLSKREGLKALNRRALRAVNE